MTFPSLVVRLTLHAIPKTSFIYQLCPSFVSHESYLVAHLSYLVRHKPELAFEPQETATSHLGGVHKGSKTLPAHRLAGAHRPKTLGAHRLAPVHKLDVHYSARREPHYTSSRGPSRFTRYSSR